MDVAKKCKHETVSITWDASGRELAHRCSTSFGCGAFLPLGPANDDDPAVAVEIRAAEIVQDVTALGIDVVFDATVPRGFTGELMTLYEQNGWLLHSWGDFPGDSAVIVDQQWSGWLAREIYRANDPHGDQDRDAGAVDQPELVDDHPDSRIEDLHIPPPVTASPDVDVEITELAGIDQSDPTHDHEDLLDQIAESDAEERPEERPDALVIEADAPEAEESEIGGESE